jgi:cation diffusion facilitator family transporter
MTRPRCDGQRRLASLGVVCYTQRVLVDTAVAPPLPDDRVRVRAGLLSLGIGAALLAVKWLAYRVTGSAAILSDALESIANVVAALFALGVLLFAGRPADRRHPYGHGKVEFFSAVFEGGLITFAAVVIIWKAVQDLVAGPVLRAVETGIALTVATGLVNAALGWYLLRTGRRTHSMTLVADGQHVLSDFWTTVGVVTGLGLVRLTGIPWLDPVAALVVAVNLAWTGASLVRGAAAALLDAEDVGLIGELVQAFERSLAPGIIRIHRLRARRAGSFTHVDAHVIVPEYWTVMQSHEALDAFAARVIAALPIDGEIIFHDDPCRRALCAICNVAGCPERVEPFETRPPLTLDEAISTDEAFWRGHHRPVPAAAAS